MNSQKDQLLAIGLMSGTSMDGVDCAIIESDGHSVNIPVTAIHISYPPDLRHQISQAMEAAALENPAQHSDFIDRLEQTLTQIHAQAVNQILNKNNLTHKDIDVIGFHGQTLCHRPDKGWTWQIGDGQWLAQKVQIPVINDFRRQDIDNGGQGAPLVPIYHQALVKGRQNPEYPVAIINIGGVSNITWIGSEIEGRMLAFDAGPGNAFLDDWVEQHTGDTMDRDGVLSAKGNVNHSLIDQWLQSPYFYKIPPKSLDRNSLQLPGLNKLTLTDGAATLVEFTSKAIEIALSHCPVKPKYIYICGGGRHNRTLMAKLMEMNIPVDVVEKLGWNGDFIEAEAFAFLACRHLLGLFITFPGTTGINQSATGGKLYQPV